MFESILSSNKERNIDMISWNNILIKLIYLISTSKGYQFTVINLKYKSNILSDTIHFNIRKSCKNDKVEMGNYKLNYLRKSNDQLYTLLLYNQSFNFLRTYKIQEQIKIKNVNGCCGILQNQKDLVVKF
ncbi:unnamed protein product [Paramecium octaurelia]|uniref:Uncharacterized protein n=1 Tax=Paramecium octaurelia TaxID=43137 RepID=A0A8S1Y5P6_PAROT|nr:unnamed protein product [Paramecium octaurelia]